MQGFKTLLFTTPLVFAHASYADTRLFTPEKVSVQLSTGLLNGEAKERVYVPDEGDRKGSQLNWKYRNAAIIKGAVEWDLMPWVSLGASGWSTYASKGGHMDDYDWDRADQKRWTDHSWHPGTKLNYANQFDFSLTGWLFNQPEWRIGVQAGYQQSRFSWTSRGGYYNYDNGAVTGAWPIDQKVIGYNQRFKLPYIGLTGMYRYQNWEVNGAFKFSNWGHAEDTDQHYDRNTTFRSRVTGQQFYGLSTDIGYYVGEKAKVYVEGTWNRLLNRRGDLYAMEHATNEGGVVMRGAGIEHTNYSVTAGLKYSF